jgi:hypothetical protein
MRDFYSFLKILKRNFIVSLFFLMGMIAIQEAVFAQLNIPLTNCQNVDGTYTDLDTNGAVITTANFDDANSLATNIGFTFNFNGLAFTQFVLNTNGFIRLGSAPPSVAGLFFTSATSSTGGPFNSTNAADVNLICAFNHDLTGGTNPEFRVHTSGTAPNRICTIQFKNMRDKTTTPAELFANINFQIILYETVNIVEIVYGSFTVTNNTDNFKTVAVGLKGSGALSGQMIAVTKGSTTIYSAATFLAGNYTGNAFNVRKTVLPDPGRILRFMPIRPNDRVVMEAYTLGKSPIPFGNPLTITAWVKNGGVNALVASTCSLNITGANTFANVQPVPALLPGDSILITFAPFSPTVTGINQAEVSIPADDNNFNNVKTKTIETNLNSYSYAQSPLAAGGVGFTGATGDFVAKFTTNSSQSVNQVNVHFAAGGQPFQIGIWSAGTSGTPGALLHSTPTYISTTGVYTVLIDPPVAIPSGSFFVGVKQTGSTNVSFAYQSEVPIRSGHFYYTSPTGGATWTDFAPNSPFRFMIEPKFALQTDVGITSATPATGMTLIAGHTYDLTALVVNYGLLSQSAIPVYYNVNGGTPVGPVPTTATIAQNATTAVNFTGSNAFTPAAAGVYTLKFFTQLTNDLSTQNDTLIVVYNVIPAPIAALPYTETFTNRLNWTISGVGGLWQYGIATGPTGQSNDTAAFADFYSVLTGNSAMLKSPAFDISSLQHPALQFDVAYRTKASENDSLQVLVSTDGGLTFLPGSPPIYVRSTYTVPSLATLAPDTADFFPSAATNWRKETVSLEQFLNATSLMLAFKASSANGNNCWIDNVHIFGGVTPTVATDPVTSIGMNAAVSGGNVTASGTSTVTARGVCWSNNPSPTLADPHTTNGNGNGAFTSNITGLAPASTYYVRAYATNSIGTSYGNQYSFSTLTPATVATVTTATVTSITHYSAVSGGDVTSDGGAPVTARGVCYSVLPFPTIADAFTNDGTGTGPFVSNLTGLVEQKPYYVRAYATNSVGVAYGSQETFTTLVDGIDEMNPDKISVLISGNEMHLTASRNIHVDHLALLDLNGRVVAEYSNFPCHPSGRITLPTLATGLYLIRIEYDQKTLLNKVVVP